MIDLKSLVPFPLRWGFTTKEDVPEDFGLTAIKQVHGSDILEWRDNLNGDTPADGLWTQTIQCPIGVRVADCVPILLAGLVRKEPWVAALHAGWRGAVAGILRRGVGVFEGLGGNPEELFYAFGPCIQRCCFEVGPEVIEAARRDAAWHDALALPTGNGKFHLDLQGILQAQARQLGLDRDKDGSIPRCTRCEGDVFYSYRRGDVSGRQWGWIEILP